MSDGHWNPPADLSYAAKQEIIRDYFTRYPRDVVIETGLYAGRGSCMELGAARTIVVDTDPENVRNVVEQYPRTEGWIVDSALAMPKLLHEFGFGVDEPAFFWLDAHVVTERYEKNHSPLREELEAILAWPHAAHSVVLIDDVRMMGLPGWPTLDDVQALTEPVWDVLVLDDVMRCTPR